VKRTTEEVKEALDSLRADLEGRGVRLLENAGEYTLGTAPEASEIIAAITKEELSKDLTKASLETLAIVLYRSPISRSEIDYVRGVNSTFILRNLQIRGLVERIENPRDLRSFLYRPTFQLLESLGVARVEDLPDHGQIVAELEHFLSTQEEVVDGQDAAGSSVSAVASDLSNDNGVVTAAGIIPESGAPGVQGVESDDSDNDNSGTEVEADVAEADEAVEGFDDDVLQSRTDVDRLGGDLGVEVGTVAEDDELTGSWDDDDLLPHEESGDEDGDNGQLTVGEEIPRKS
jgi:segregation and condensation protein B